MKVTLGESAPRGIQKSIFDEAKPIVFDGLEVVQKNAEVFELLEKQVAQYSNLEKVLNFSALFSVMTGISMEWSRKDTLVQLAVGSFLQHIGITQIHGQELELSAEDMADAATVKEFKKHPFIGARIMGEYGNFTEVAKQIVYQRNEWFNGGGFPNKVSGFKIFPPARIVALCSDFAKIMCEKDCDPIEALKTILSSPESASIYDPEVIRGLVGTFNKKKKK